MKSTKKISALIVVFLLLTSCKSTLFNKENTEVLYQIPIIETATSSYQIVENDTIKFDTVSLKMPEEYSIVSKSDFMIENEDGSVLISVEDKTNCIDNFDEYINQTITSLKQMGIVPSAPQEVVLGEYTAKRIDFNMLEIENSNSKYYCYYIKMNQNRIIVNVVLNDFATLNSSQVNTLVSELDFKAE